jgi:hypothetical protein
VLCAIPSDLTNFSTMTTNRQKIIDDFKSFAEKLCSDTELTVKKKKQGGLGRMADLATSTFKNYDNIKTVLEGMIMLKTKDLNDPSLVEELTTIKSELSLSWLEKYVKKL